MITLKTSVILPTYNERENITGLIEEILEKAIPFEVLVIDDDSPDRTWEVVENLGDPRVRVIRRVGERGLTSAIRKGIAESKGDAVVWMDCDFSMPPSVIPSLIESLESSDIAIGSRYIEGARDERASLRERLGSRVINTIARFLLGSGIKDYTSGFVAAKREVFKEIDIKGDYGEYCIDFLYRAKRDGFTIREVPYICVTRRAGESKTAVNLFNYLRRGLRYLYTVLRLRFSHLLS